MTIEKPRLQLEGDAYISFQHDWKTGEYKGQRYGQAFYNTFKLHKMANQDQLRGIYEELDEKQAQKTINSIFSFN